MDNFLIEDVIPMRSQQNGSVKITNVHHHSIPAAVPLPSQTEIPAAWVHPELKRIRLERTQRAYENERRLEVAEQHHNSGRQRVLRLSRSVETQKAKLEALTRQRDQLAVEVEGEEAKLRRFQDVELSFNDQLIFHKAALVSGVISTLPSSLQQQERSAWLRDGKLHCSSWLHVAEPQDVTATTTTATATARGGSVDECLKELTLLEMPFTFLPLSAQRWYPLNHKNQNIRNATRDQMREFVNRVLPVASFDGVNCCVTAFDTFSDPCLLESASSPCRSVSCRYHHIHSVTHWLVVGEHMLSYVAGILGIDLHQVSSKQDSNVCAAVHFFADVRRRLIEYGDARDDDRIEMLLIDSVNTMLGYGWFSIMPPMVNKSSSNNKSPNNIHSKKSVSAATSTSTAAASAAATAPPTPTVAKCWTLPKANPPPLRILDDIVEKRLGYFSSPEEITVLEHIALLCGSLQNSSVEDIVRCCMSVFQESNVAVAWRLAARVCRDAGDHRRALWLLETAVGMFPVDPALRMERLHCMITLNVDPVAIVQHTSQALDVLTRQACALVLAKQPVLVTTLSKHIGYMLAYVAVHVSMVHREAALALLTCAVEAPGRYSVTPYALQNLALMLGILRSSVSLESCRSLPLASINDFCFRVASPLFASSRSGHVKAADAVRQAMAPILQRQLALIDQSFEAGVSARVCDTLRCALRCTILSLYQNQEQVVNDTLSHLEPDPRSYHAELWAFYFSRICVKKDGSNATLDLLKGVSCKPTIPLWFHMRVAGCLRSVAPQAPIVQETIINTAKTFGSQMGLDHTSVSPAQLSDANVHTRFKSSSWNWAGFVMVTAATSNDPRHSISLLRALPVSLLNVHLDTSLMVFYEKISYLFHDRVQAVKHPSFPSASSPSASAAVAATSGANSSGIGVGGAWRSSTSFDAIGAASWDLFREMVEEELRRLLDQQRHWLSNLDYFCSSDCITAAHDFVRVVYRDLSTLCEIPSIVHQSRIVLLEVAENLRVVHPLLIQQQQQQRL